MSQSLTSLRPAPELVVAPPAQARDLRPGGISLTWCVAALAVASLGLLLYVKWHPFSIPAVIDARLRFQALEGLLERGENSTEIYSMVGPLFSVPLYYLGKVWGTPQEWVQYFNLAVFGVLLGAFLTVGKRFYSPTVCVATAVVLIAGSMFGGHIQFYMGEPFTAVAVVLGVFMIYSDRFWPGALALALGTVNTPAAAIALSMMCAYWMITFKRLRFALIPLLWLGLFMLECEIRRGGRSGYEGVPIVPVKTVLPYSGRYGFVYPVPFGVLSLIFSFGKGLLFFAPGLALLPIVWSDLAGVDHRSPRKGILVSFLIFTLGLLLTYAGWWNWHGDDYWGPRYLLFASVPASLIIGMVLSSRARSFAQHALILTVLLWSGWVCVNGTVFFLESVGLLQANTNYQLAYLTWYVPEFSPLLHVFIPHLWHEYSVDWKEFTYGGVLLAGMLVLSLPVAWEVTRQLGAMCRSLLHTVGSRSFWRF